MGFIEPDPQPLCPELEGSLGTAQGGKSRKLSTRPLINRLPDNLSALGKQDFLGAMGLFLIVFLSTFPVVVPFIFMHNVLLALRISNIIAIVMLFLSGYWLGRYAGYRPWRMGFSMVTVGSVLVLIIIALGDKSVMGSAMGKILSLRQNTHTRKHRHYPQNTGTISLASD